MKQIHRAALRCQAFKSLSAFSTRFDFNETGILFCEWGILPYGNMQCISAIP
jgi:hypothetical protein